MDKDSIPREIIVRLKDISTIDPDFDKNYATVFVQQDKKYVDVLVFNEENSYSVLTYNPESIVKFTMKSLKTSQIYGTSYIVLRILKDLKKRYAHVLPLDGRTYCHLDIGDRYRPNIKVEYQWKQLTNHHLLTLNTKQIDFDNSFIKEAKETDFNDAERSLREIKDQLVAALNDQLESDSEENQAHINALQTKMFEWIDKINQEKADMQAEVDKATNLLNRTKSIHNEEEAKTHKEADDIFSQGQSVSDSISTIDSHTEESRCKNLEVRK